ncbi:MAG: hypothetical protein J6R85_00915, partial [Lentisphaeria bacterium]|nr:hypothetical protein [Lentisphaeria bacterium]
VTIPCRPGTKVHRVPQTNAVMLGNLFNNPALQVLYARYQTAVDEAWPGKNGYTVESIPEPFRRGADVIVLGASDNTGLAAAADAFIASVAKHGSKGDLTIPHTFAYRYASSIKADDTKPDHMEKGISTAHQRLKAGTHTSLGGHLAAIAGRYLQYRNPADAKLYVTVARIYAESAKADARKFGGAWGFDSDFPSGQAIFGWDLIEHDPALTAADRLDVSNMILRWMEEAIYAEAKGGLKQTSPCSNHLTFCSMGAMSAGFYFDKYYADQLPQAKEWLKTICHNFKRAWAYGKALDDCDGYQWLTWRHVLVYAMSYPDDTPLQTTVPTAIRIAGITMDNLGYQAPYGDTSGWTSSGSIMPVLRMYYAATRDPLAAYLLSRKQPERVIAGNYSALPGKVEEPTTLNGVVLHPLDQGYYRFVPAEGKNPPLSRCFDKMTFRENMDPASLYVLVDGINNGGHRHADANSVLRFTQFGREWLAENNYFKPQQKYHNTLLLLCNGESFALPDYMEVRGNRENDDTAAISIRAMEYGPAEWVRHYVWLKKDQAWMLIDEVTASKEGNFRLTQRWNGIGDAVKRPDGVELQQTNAAMRLQTPGTHAVTVTDDPELGESWAGYPFATTPVIRVIDQQFEGKLQKGETIRMASLWHGTAGKDNAPEWSIDSNGGEYRINTGKNTYTVTFDAGKLPIVRSAASAEGVKPRKAAADVAAGNKVPAPEILYQNLYSAKSLLRLTAPENRKILNIQVTAPEPGDNNILVTSAVNAARAVSDGGWSDAGDSTMYKPDQPVTVDFTLEKPRAFTEAELRLWWGASSTKGTAYQLKSVEVLAGNDLNSLKRLALLDTSKDQHPDFGKTVVYRIPVQTEPVKYVRFHLVPRAGTALYIGEITLLGHPVPGDKISGELSNLSRIIAAKKGNEKYYVISSAEGAVRLLTTDGKPAGEFRIAGGVDDMATYDLDNDGTDELLLGCQDGYLRAVGLDGAEKWKVKFEFYRTFPKVTVVRVADLNNDGEKEILAGVENWRTYAFDRTGKEIWRFEVIHPTRSVQPVDLDGDGKLEIICGTRYMWARVLSSDGLHRWGGRFGTGCRATAAPKTGKDGVRNVVLG